MRVLSLAAIASAALLPLAGCGSTSGSGPATTRTDTTTSAPPSTATSAKGSGPQLDTAPRYARPSPSAPIQAGVIQVAYRYYGIDPDTLRVKVGSTIRWTNYDPAEHNVTSESGPQRFASGSFGEGASFQVKLTKAGVIHYESTTQPATMNGTIEVVG